jgi:hypothetical protein
MATSSIYCAAITDLTACAAAATSEHKCAAQGSTCVSTRDAEETACLSDIVASEQAGTPYASASASTACLIAHQAYAPCVSAASATECGSRNDCEWSLAASNPIAKDFCAVKGADLAVVLAMKTLGSKYVDGAAAQMLACKVFDDATSGCSSGAAALTFSTPSPSPLPPQVEVLELFRQCGGTGGNCSR